MNKKFYLVLICILSCSVILLGLSYSEKSSNNVETGIIEKNNSSYKAVFSTNDKLDTAKNNELKVTLINKKNEDTNYALYLKEIDDDMVVDVAYTIDGVNYHLLTDNVIDLGVLSSYGTLGDLSTYTIALSSNNDYVFDYYIDEYTFVDEVSYDS
jgi:hypothetical protein